MSLYKLSTYNKDYVKSSLALIHAVSPITPCPTLSTQTFANNAFIMINDPITPKIIIPTIKRLKRHTAELADYMRLYRARVRGSQLADRHRQQLEFRKEVNTQLQVKLGTSILLKRILYQIFT